MLAGLVSTRQNRNMACCADVKKIEEKAYDGASYAFEVKEKKSGHSSNLNVTCRLNRATTLM